MGEGGALTPGERFDRLERSMNEGFRRIESKLDSKADSAVVHMLDERVKIIESGNTPLGRMYLQQFESLVHRVDNIESTGTRQAQEALREAKAIQIQVAALANEARDRATAVKIEAASSARRQRILIGLVSLLNVVVATHDLQSIGPDAAILQLNQGALESWQPGMQQPNNEVAQS